MIPYTIFIITSLLSYVGCSPLRLGSISTPQINSRCSSLLDDMSQLVEGIQDENIIFCYSSEATLQGAVAMAYCNEGFERVGPDRVTCSPDGSWGELPTCQRISTASSGKYTFIILNVASAVGTAEAGLILAYLFP